MEKIPHMTKCQFAYIAHNIRDTHPKTTGNQFRRLRNIADNFADALSLTNNGFKRETFLNACGISDSEIWAFDKGFEHAAHCVEFNAPTIGATINSEESPDGRLVGVDNASEIHFGLAMEAESHARQFSPWEFVAKEINDLPEHVREAAWEAYDFGVEARILADLQNFEIADYLPDDSDTVPANGD